MSEFLSINTKTGKVGRTSSSVGLAPKPIDFSDVFVIGLGGSGGSGVTDSGELPLVLGQSYIDVVFTNEQSTDWKLMACEVVNTVDPTPLNIWPGIITARLTTGFRVQLNGLPDSSNYVLHWAISGTPVVMATTYTLTGPSSGFVAAPSTNFTVALPAGESVAAPVTVTPSDGGGGTFTPTSVVLTTAAPSATFTYTAASVGVKTISTTNSGGLTNPASRSYTAAASTVATTYTLTGPSSGKISVASTNFTAALPGGSTVPGPVTVTPSDGGAGGTFTPTTVSLTTASPSQTFTYTPASYGAKTISATNDGGLTNPSNLTYTSLAAAYTFTGPSTGAPSVASTNFTVALPAGGVVSGTVTVTPADGGGGGTFTPTTVNLTTGAPSATFTYTPASIGAKTLSVTNSGTLTNPANLTYTAAVPGLADGDPVSSWTDSSGNGHHATNTGSARPIFKTAILNGKPVVRFNAANLTVLNIASINADPPWTIIAVMIPVSTTTALGSLISDPGGFPLPALLNSDGNVYVANKAHYGSIGPYATGAQILTSMPNGTGTPVLYKNGTAISLTGAVNVTASNFAMIGNPTQDGDLAEIIFYNSELGSTDRANVEKYLGTKYAISVAGGSAVQPDTVTGLVAWWKADSL